MILNLHVHLFFGQRLPWQLESLLQVLVPRLRQRWKTVINQILLPILIDCSPLAKLADEAVMHALYLEEWLVLELIITMPIHIMHYIVMH